MCKMWKYMKLKYWKIDTLPDIWTTQSKRHADTQFWTSSLYIIHIIKTSLFKMVFQMVIFMRCPHKVLYMVLPDPPFELHIQSNIILILNTCIKIELFWQLLKWSIVKSNCFTYSNLKHAALTTKVLGLRNSYHSLN